jgi:RNA polymerase-associated protein CTR9/transcription factor SPN1
MKRKKQKLHPREECKDELLNSPIGKLKKTSAKKSPREYQEIENPCINLKECEIIQDSSENNEENLKHFGAGSFSTNRKPRNSKSKSRIRMKTKSRAKIKSKSKSKSKSNKRSKSNTKSSVRRDSEDHLNSAKKSNSNTGYFLRSRRNCNEEEVSIVRNLKKEKLSPSEYNEESDESFKPESNSKSISEKNKNQSEENININHVEEHVENVEEHVENVEEYVEKVEQHVEIVEHVKDVEHLENLEHVDPIKSKDNLEEDPNCSFICEKESIANGVESEDDDAIEALDEQELDEEIKDLQSKINYFLY